MGGISFEIHETRMKAKDAEIERLRAQCAAYEGQLKYGDSEIKRLRAELDRVVWESPKGLES